MIILLLFFLSFLLFIVSLYFTFIREKRASDLTQSEIAEIVNVETGNIDYTPPVTSQETETVVQIPDETAQTPVQPTEENLAPEQQMIVDFYQAVNAMDMSTLYTLTDAHLESSNVFKTYYSKNRLSKFSATIVAPKIVVKNIQEELTTSSNPDIKNLSYTLEYTLASNQQKFTEERSTVLVKKGDEWRIGKLLCETKGCSTMPFFNPEKYK